METFSALLVLCARNSPVTSEYPSQRPVTRSLRFSLICAWTNAWVNNRDAGDWRHHRAHYDVTVIYEQISDMMTSRYGNALCIIGDLCDESTGEGPVRRTLVFFVVCLNNLLNKYSHCRWFDTLWRPSDVTTKQVKNQRRTDNGLLGWYRADVRPTTFVSSMPFSRLLYLMGLTITNFSSPDWTDVGARRFLTSFTL